MLNIYDAFLKALTVIFGFIVQILLIIMVAIITWLVFSRQLLGSAPSWVEEISLVMIIWFGLIGATFGVRERYHLRMDLFFKMFPPKIRTVIAYFTDALVVAFGAMLLIGGINHVILTMGQTLPATKLPGAIRYLPLPITGALIILYGIRNLIGGPANDR